MIIAVSMHVLEKSSYPETCDALSHDWVRLLEPLGVTPLLVPNTLRNPAQYAEELQISGVLLTGGNDIGRQSGEPWSVSSDVAECRDRTERSLLDVALARQVPMLGVCRGMQFLNVYFGGTLVRDVAVWTHGEQHVAVQHRLTIIDADYRQQLGGRETFSTNSFHHHGVTLGTLAPRLKPIAVSSGQVVEALYHPTLPVLGLQWHPEREGPDQQVGATLIRQWLDWCAREAKSQPFV